MSSRRLLRACLGWTERRLHLGGTPGAVLCTELETREWIGRSDARRAVTVTPATKASAFERYIASRPELTHVRTRKKSPHTNGVVECFSRVLKYEDLYRDLPADDLDLTLRAAAHRDLYNQLRPHEHLAWARPLETFLAEPTTPVSTRQPGPIA